MDETTTLFLAAFPDRFGAAIAEAIRHEAPRFEGSPLIGAAITTADWHTVPALQVCTEQRFQEILQEYRESPVFSDDDRPSDVSLRSWPDEWDWCPEGSLTGPESLRGLSNAFTAHYEDRYDELDEDQREAFQEQWLEGGFRALVASLGHPLVREVFVELDADPLLVVTDTDGGRDLALRSFEELNAGRDDERYLESLEYWRS